MDVEHDLVTEAIDRNVEIFELLGIPEMDLDLWEWERNDE